jgi:hypothetical protein
MESRVTHTHVCECTEILSLLKEELERRRTNWNSLSNQLNQVLMSAGFKGDIDRVIKE